MDPKSFAPFSLSPLCSVSFCAGSQVDMRAMFPSECDQCVSECDVTSCPINLEKEQCTDRCLVVPCEQECLDACHSCFDSSQKAPDPNECRGFGDVCPTSAIHLNPEATLSRQSNVHHNYPPLDWNSVTEDIEAFFCSCNTYKQPHYIQQDLCNHYFPSSQTQTQDGSYASLVRRRPSLEQASTPSSPSSALLASNSSSRSTPDLSVETSLSQTSNSTALESEAYSEEEWSRCLWDNCGRLLASSYDLTSHVTSDHLSQYAVQQHEMACLWNDCNIYPTPLPAADRFGTVPTDTYMNQLLRHIQQDHLGVIVNPTEIVETAGTPFDGDTHSIDIDPVEQAPSSLESTPKIGQSDLFCRWHACPLANVAFVSSEELTQHITDAHVGMGNSRYHCYWGDCNRHGESGFSSKQKILRHIQSHTGYRPFKCELCDQYFSEAATLQQHRRRHTKEKPFICPEPGCGKAFAIAGALTIHRRVHSGSKPFKCKYCDRSFSESSNLSKHIRTHTGDRPYACGFPGCDKRFARPDQVTRHRNTHEKKK
ncbi:hypothetical protein Clacol_005520 [Clathrus columnatus]|uniref:C2H2-type domain-containing protein n=1 Tax=Clathrus columnatus TaxID=1419009 RepID=A0AAV5ADU0_9AGAM|nr:hypothetical protein Clacol_005520 [Clathrus columnatus]